MTESEQDMVSELAGAVARAESIKVERDALRTENNKLKAAIKKAAEMMYDLGNEMEVSGG